MTLDTLTLMLELDARGLNAGDVERALAGLNKSVGQTDQAVKQLDDKVAKLGSSFASVGGTMSVAFSAPLLALGAAAMTTAGKLQQAMIGFETMLHSAEAAKDFIGELRDFAAKTPFEFPGLVSSAQRLLALGFAAKEIIPTLQAVGGAAAALGRGQEGIDRITLALGQMRAKGKVSAEEMMQLAEAGIPAWKYLADAIGQATGKIVTTGEAMKIASKGMVDGVGAVNVLVAAMDRDFGQLMGRQSETLLGVWSNFQDKMTFILTDLGTALTPTVNKWLEQVMKIGTGLGELVKSFSELPDHVKSLATSFGLVAVAAGPVALGVGKLVSVVSSFGPALAAMNGPVGLAVVGLVGLATAIQSAWQQQQEFEATVAQFDAAQAITASIELKSGIKDLNDQLRIGADESWPDYIKRLAEFEAEASDTAELFNKVKLSLAKDQKGGSILVPSVDPEAIKQAQKDAAAYYDTLGTIAQASKAANAQMQAQLTQQRAAMEELKKRAAEGVLPWQNLGKEAGLALSKATQATVGAKDAVVSLLRPTELTKAELEKMAKAVAELGAAQSWKAMADGVGSAKESVEALLEKVDMLQAVLANRGVLPELLEQGANENLQEYATRLQNLVNVMNSNKEGVERTLAVNKQLSSDWKKLTNDVQKFEEEMKKLKTEEFTKQLKESQVSVADLAKAMQDAGEIIRLGVLANVAPLNKTMQEVRRGIVDMLDEFYSSRDEVPMLNDVETLRAATDGLRQSLGVPFTFNDPFTGMAITVKALISDFGAAKNAYSDLMNQGSRAAAAFGLSTIIEQQTKLIELEKAYAAAIESRFHTGSQLQEIDMLRMRQRILKDNLSIMIQLGQTKGPEFKNQFEELKVINGQLEKVDEKIQKVTTSTGFWGDSFKKMSQQVSTIVSDFAKNVAEAFISIFKNNNAGLDKQVEDLRRSLEEQTRAWEEYATEASARIEEITATHAAAVEEEQANVRASFAERVHDYDSYVEDIGRRLDELRTTSAEKLAGELEDLRRSLEDRAEAYSEYVQDANTRLARIGEDLSETLADQTRNANRRRSDEDTDYARDKKSNEEKMQSAEQKRLRALANANTDYTRDRQRLSEELRQAESRHDVVRAAEIRTQLQQRTQDHATATRRIQEDYEEETRGLRSELEQRIAAHQTALQRIQEDADEAAANARQNAERQTADINTELGRRAADFAEYQADIHRREQEAITSNAETQRRQEEDLKRSLTQRTEDLERYRAEAEKKLEDITAKHKAQQEKELADLQKALADKLAAYDKYVADNEKKMKELEDEHKNMWDRVVDAGKAAFEALATGILRIMLEEAFKPLAKMIIDWAKDAFKPISDAIRGALSGLGGSAASTVGGAIPMPPWGTSIPGGMPGMGGGAGVAGGIASAGIMGTIGAIGSAVSAVSGIIGNFQMRSMGKDLARMEVTSRETFAELFNLRTDEWARFLMTMEKTDSVQNTLWGKFELLFDKLDYVRTGIVEKFDILINYFTSKMEILFDHIDALRGSLVGTGSQVPSAAAGAVLVPSSLPQLLFNPPSRSRGGGDLLPSRPLPFRSRPGPFPDEDLGGGMQGSNTLRGFYEIFSGLRPHIDPEALAEAYTSSQKVLLDPLVVGITTMTTELRGIHESVDSAADRPLGPFIFQNMTTRDAEFAKTLLADFIRQIKEKGGKVF